MSSQKMPKHKRDWSIGDLNYRVSEIVRRWPNQKKARLTDLLNRAWAISVQMQRIGGDAEK